MPAPSAVGQRAAGEDAHHVAFPFGCAADVVTRLGRLSRGVGSGGEHVVARKVSDEDVLGRGDLGVDGVDRGERDARSGHRAVGAELEVGGDAHGGVVADLPLELLVVAAGRPGRHRDPYLGDHLVVGECVGEDVDDEIGDRDDALAAAAAGHHVGAGGEQHRVPVTLRVAVGDGAAERAPVPDERIRDPGCRGLDRTEGELGANEVGVAHERADDERAVVSSERVEIGDAVDVDELRRVREAGLHHREEALAPCEEPHLVAAGLGRDRLVDRARRHVVESGREHPLLLPRRWSEPLDDENVTPDVEYGESTRRDGWCTRIRLRL